MNNNGGNYQKAMHENMVLYGIAHKGIKKDSGSLVNMLRTAAYFIYYHFKNDRAIIIGDKFLNTIENDREYSIKLMNIDKDPIMGPFLSSKLVDIKEHHLILVPKLLNDTTLSVIQRLNEGSFDAKTFLIPKKIDPNYMISKNEDVYDSSKYVQIRILCSNKIPIRIKSREPRGIMII